MSGPSDVTKCCFYITLQFPGTIPNQVIKVTNTFFSLFHVNDPSSYLPCDLLAIIRRHQPSSTWPPNSKREEGSKGAGLFPRIALNTTFEVVREGPSVPEMPNQVRRTKYHPNLAQSRPLGDQHLKEREEIGRNCVSRSSCTNAIITFGISIRSKTWEGRIFLVARGGVHAM